MNRFFAALAIWVVAGLGCLVLGFWLRAIDAPEWLQPDATGHLRPWMVEADCYSQLARVQRILNGQGLIQNHFKVENWPEGLVPSTTSTFDYIILLVYAPLRLFATSPVALDWAGALVSPLLWGALVLFWMFFRSREFTWLGRALLLLGSAALPALIWATSCGRPRHQSLIMVLMALGWTAEYERWHMVVTPRRAWSIFAGLIWGVACWTSLFEPTLVVTVLLLFNLLMRHRESLALLISFGAVMLLALLVEGVHIYVPPAQYQPELANWLGTISEVHSIDFSVLAQQMTTGLLLLPFVAWPLWTRENFNKTDRLLILLTFLLTLLTFLQGRWIYYACLGELFVIVRFFQMAPTHWTRLTVLVIFLLGLADADYTQLEGVRTVAANQPSQQLLQISRSIDQPGGILAPWWLSPALLYFSGHPIVAGSSHCGISGIVASANFYNASSWVEAEKILQDRQVRWVVVYDNPNYFYPTLNKARGILGLPLFVDDDSASKAEANATVAQTLVNDRYVPTWMRLRAVTPELKLYQYVPVTER